MTHDEKRQLFEANIPLVKHISTRYKCPPGMQEDLLQEGYLALWRMIDSEKYDSTKGRFSTLAGRYIQNAMFLFVVNAYNRSGLSASTDTLKRVRYTKSQLNDVGDDVKHDDIKEVLGFKRDKDVAHISRLFNSATTTDSVRDDDEDDTHLIDRAASTIDTYTLGPSVEAVLHETLGKLSQGEQEVIRLRYGFDGEPMTFQEIAARLGVTPTTAKNRLRRANQHLQELLPADLLQE